MGQEDDNLDNSIVTGQSPSNAEGMGSSSSKSTPSPPNESANLPSANITPAEHQRSLRIKVRDRLVLSELPQLQKLAPSSCKLSFDDPDKLYDFHIRVKPDEGYWQGGEYVFHVNVTEEYNFSPPKVKCLTKIWHPNINEDGAVCLSILRQASVDEAGWNPTRQLKDVVWGINFLFTDLLNFEDPLNTDAADMFKQDPSTFLRKVKEYIRKYAQ